MTEAIATYTRPARALQRWTPWSHRPTELMLVAAWFCTTTARFPYDTLVLYALTTFFMIGVYLHRATVIPLAMRGWPIFLLPLWELCSPLWSAVPATSLKIAMQLILTVLICCYIAARLGQRAFIGAIFAALTVWELASAPRLGDYENFQGVFTDKNFLALRMSVLVFSGLVIVLDRAYPRLLRFIAMPVTGLALVMIVLSHSAGAAISGGLGAMVIVGSVFVWAPFKNYRALIVAVMLALGLGVATVVAQGPKFDPEQEVLGAFGKDSTLTGRQELWEYASELIKQKPILGLGPGGFWLTDRNDAQELLETHYKERGTQFVFHNSYLEVLVYLGIPGLILALIGWVWTCAVNFGRLLKYATTPAAFFAAMAIVSLARSYVESDLWQPFEFMGMIGWAGALCLYPRASPPRRA